MNGADAGWAADISALTRRTSAFGGVQALTGIDDGVGLILGGAHAMPCDDLSVDSLEFRARREVPCLPVTRTGGQGVTPQVLLVTVQHPGLDADTSWIALRL